jgi:hypothetical protein
VFVSAGQATKVGAVARTGARNEETHLILPAHASDRYRRRVDDERGRKDLQYSSDDLITPF